MGLADGDITVGPQSSLQRKRAHQSQLTGNPHFSRLPRVGGSIPQIGARGCAGAPGMTHGISKSRLGPRFYM